MLAREGSHAAALRVLSIVIGVFLIFMGLDKIGWLTDASILMRRLQEWRGMVRPFARWYLDTIAIPGAPVFARVILLAELTAGTALILGFHERDDPPRSWTPLSMYRIVIDPMLLPN